MLVYVKGNENSIIYGEENSVTTLTLNGVTQKELAKLLEVTQAYISKLESNKRISAKVMLRVNKVLESNS